MNKFYSICTVAFLILGLLACKNDTGLSGTEGILRLAVGMSDKVTVVSRSLSSSDEAELEKDCKIRIYSGSTLVRKYQGVANIPATISLSGGSYSVRVTAGDSVSASFEKRFFEGVKSFVIGGGEETEVNVVCGIANTVVSHTWDESLKEVFEGTYQVQVVSATGSLVFSSDQSDAKGYFSLPDSDRKLTFKFSATKKGGEKYEVVKKLESARAATLYNLTWKCNPEGETTGGAMLAVELSEKSLSDVDNSITIKFPRRPVVTCCNSVGVEYELDQPMYMGVKTNDKYSLVIATCSPLTEALLQNDKFQNYGLPVNNINMMHLGNQEAELSAAGITMISPSIESEKGGIWKIEFSEALIQKMTAEKGEIVTKLTAIDKDNRQTIVTWRILVTDDTVLTLDANPGDIWTTKAKLRGKEVGTLNGTPKFQYRVKDSGSWTSVADVAYSESESGEQIFYKEITGLTPGTTYEYQAVDGELTSSVICKFTTEEKAQLPNSGFESWSGDVPKLIYGQGEGMFWDSGNHGSKKGNVNITTPDNTYKHSGDYSAKLESRNIIIQFAAGNIFIGQYLDTQMDGLTGHGVLGFGRPFASRPKALHGYIRYESGIVDKGGDKISNGSQDKGIIYIALTSGEEEDYNGSQWSCIIRTKDKKFFDKNASNVIAYGEQIWDTSTEGDGMIEFTIPLVYRKSDVASERIVLVAAASMYGDYFQGSTGSTMWLDDFELIYE